MFNISAPEWTAILLSLRVATVATLIATPVGIAIAWLLSRREFWGKALLDAIVHLPLVLFLLWALAFTLEYHPPVLPG